MDKGFDSGFAASGKPCELSLQLYMVVLEYMEHDYKMQVMVN